MAASDYVGAYHIYLYHPTDRTISITSDYHTQTNYQYFAVVADSFRVNAANYYASNEDDYKNTYSYRITGDSICFIGSQWYCPYNFNICISGTTTH